jgi:hypothetical protein
MFTQNIGSMSGPLCSAYNPCYLFVGQIYFGFHCLSLIETITFPYLRWIFITTISSITNCIIGIKRRLLILSFFFVNNSYHNIFFISFYNFYFENEDWIEWHNLVENKLSTFKTFLTYKLDPAVGSLKKYIKFMSIRLSRTNNVLYL